MNKNIIFTLGSAVGFLIVVFFITNHLTNEKINYLKHQKYINVAKDIQNQAKVLVQEKKNATLTIGMTLAENDAIKTALTENRSQDIDFHKFSLKLRKYSDFKNVWFHLIKPDGTSFYRSWTDKKGDSILDYRIDIVELIDDPKIMSTVSVGMYDMTFKSIIPLFKDNKFIGIIEVITHFNSIAKTLMKKGIEPVILVDKHYKDQLKYPFTKTFIDDYYVAILNASKKHMKLIEQKGVDHFINEKHEYHLPNEDFVTLYKLLDINENPMAYFILFMPQKYIDMSQISIIKEKMWFYIILLIIVISIFIYYYFTSKYTKEIKILNSNLKSSLKKQTKLQEDKIAQEKILSHQSKLASMGEMIGNIAHQWRQPLSAISTTASGIKVKKEFGQLDDQFLSESLDKIIKFTQHLSNTIDDFKNFFRTDKEKVRFNLNDIIEKDLVLIDASFKNNHIKLVKELDADITMVSYPNELTQAILNIINNAKDIVKIIEPETDRVVMVSTKIEDDNILINIKDSGGGIPSDIQGKIFEPYFTTKHQSQGTGIGLYMTRQIITEHMEGTIDVTNESFIVENKKYFGANFTITIPIQEEIQWD